MGKSWENHGKKSWKILMMMACLKLFVFGGKTDGFSESGMKFGNGKNGKRGTSPKN